MRLILIILFLASCTTKRQESKPYDYSDYVHDRWEMSQDTTGQAEYLNLLRPALDSLSVNVKAK